jgi:cardiolipin synthase
MNRWFDKHKYHNGNAVKFLESGKKYFDELELVIRAAKNFIHIQAYIFENDETGKRIIALLIEAARRGVHVFIVIDSYGSVKLSKIAIRLMRKEGILIKRFSPIHPSWAFRFRIGRRLHHKIVLVDGNTSLIGGINIARKYEGNANEVAWLDFAVRVNGPVNKDVRRICEDVWGRKQKRLFKKTYYQALFSTYQNENLPVRLLQNDWVRRRIELSRFYRNSIKNAQHSIVIVASYFIPGNRLRYLLRKASERGVKIILLLSSQSDVGLARHATNYLYPFLLRNNIEIYRWQPSILHGKLIIVDGQYTSIGSYNLNALSDYGSLELNVCVDDHAFASTVQERFDEYIQQNSIRVTREDYHKQDHWFKKLCNWVSYQLVRILFKLFFFLMKY